MESAPSTKNDLVMYISIAIGVAIIISSFSIIIKQYERAIILRLGKYQKQVDPGIQKKIPFVDNVLVVDIWEKVENLRSKECLQKIIFL
ncbi:MAG TPA: SPFH domain-containing protein [Nitrososphaeraceae archaeon]